MLSVRNTAVLVAAYLVGVATVLGLYVLERDLAVRLFLDPGKPVNGGRGG